MTATSAEGGAFTRVIAALDVTSHDERILASAAEIAARLGVEVAGLFIEDINLFRIAALPVTRHLAIGQATAVSLDAERLSADMQVLAARAAADLESSAARHGVKSSFRVVRGLPAAEIAAGTMAEDLLIVGASRAMAGLPFALGSSLQEAALRAARCVLQARQAMPPRRPLVAVRANSTVGMHAVAATLRVMGSTSGELTILLIGSPAETARAAGPIEATVSAHGCQARLRHLKELTPHQLAGIAQQGRHDMLIVAFDLVGLAGGEALPRLMTAPCDVLIIR